MITSVPSVPGVSVTVTAPVRHLCPFKDEIDDGRLTLSWRTDHSTVELHSLRQFLGVFADARISHEEVVSEIWGAMNRVAGIRSVTVSTTWRTAGMEVACEVLRQPVHPTGA